MSRLTRNFPAYLTMLLCVSVTAACGTAAKRQVDDIVARPPSASDPLGVCQWILDATQVRSLEKEVTTFGSKKIENFSTSDSESLGAGDKALACGGPGIILTSVQWSSSERQSEAEKASQKYSNNPDLDVPGAKEYKKTLGGTHGTINYFAQPGGADTQDLVNLSFTFDGVDDLRNVVIFFTGHLKDGGDFNAIETEIQTAFDQVVSRARRANLPDADISSD